jgi:hypothetical protein
LLSIVETVVFERDAKASKDPLGVLEVQPVLVAVRSVLGFIPTRISFSIVVLFVVTGKGT